MNIDLSGKSVVVTGGVGAIGSAMCKKLCHSGADVIIVDKDGRGETLAQELREIGTKSSFIYGDVTDKASMEEMAEKAIETYGKIDVLVNNAGINVGNDGRKQIQDFRDQDWHNLLNVDLNGVYYCSKPVIGDMIKKGGGKIINISSIVGLVPLRNCCAFAAAKAGVINLTKAMALELAQFNIAVNCICPGSVIFEGTRQLYYADQAKAKRMLSHIPMGRPAEPDEISGAIVFLCSDEASYMTGSVMTIDGGWTCGFARDF